ncbi:hypothetical protein D770_12265 [Flammeovirgaceae bacterium 311]|nr:hypothetical protein D770_12265 [Flammeovirgaceae bacterium 311]
MRHSFLFLILSIMALTPGTAAQHNLSLAEVKAVELQLDDVMEVMDTILLKAKMQETERQFEEQPTLLNKVRLGIIYHEAALNLSFLSRTAYKGYAKRSFEILSDVFDAPSTTKAIMPFVASYRASALSLVGAETKKLGLVGDSFRLLNDAVEKYAHVSYLPEFLRGSVSENLPWFFFSKRHYAKRDFESIISKYESNSAYANKKIMSFTYWAWSNQHQSKKYRKQALAYLDAAIALDPAYKAGRQRAEQLKAKLTK